MRSPLIWTFVIVLVTGGSLLARHSTAPPPSPAESKAYIVTATSLERARLAVIEVGGEITHELRIIKAVGARLSDRQVDDLRSSADVKRVYRDERVEISAKPVSAAADDKCKVKAASQIEFGSDDVFWTLANYGKSDLEIAQVALLWPGANERLDFIDFGNSRLYTGRIYGVAAAFDRFREEEENDNDKSKSLPVLSARQKKSLRLDFGDALRDRDGYEIRVVFNNGCMVEYPSKPSKRHEGDSDIDAKRTFVSSLVGADAMHWQDVTGAGVGVAIVDTGIWAEQKGKGRFLFRNSFGAARITGHYDAIADQKLPADFRSDANGHGTHVASILASSRHRHSEFNGIAPDAELVIVKAFDEDGAGTYLDVIRGLDWILRNRDSLGIRVINLSFSASPRSWYWDDPLNQAVMALWQSGIVVVASAGNNGPEPMTIGAPGNVPYVITVGAMTDNVTPLDWTDDALASFSSAGPTAEAFIKPELVAPGGHIRGLMPADGKVAKKHPHWHDGDSYYTMSGTSQAAAIVSGAAALLLQQQPTLTPDDIKCRLLGNSRAAIDDEGQPAYSVFQQGMGMLDVEAASKSTLTGCANGAMDIAADLDGTAHYRGPADIVAGGFEVGDAKGSHWDGAYRFSDGYFWSKDFIWFNGIIWNDVATHNNGIIWNDIATHNNGIIWNDSTERPVSINTWVDHE